MKWDPVFGDSDNLGGVPSIALGKALGNDRAVAEERGALSESRTVSPVELSGVSADTGSPSLSPGAAPVLPPYVQSGVFVSLAIVSDSPGDFILR